MSAKQTQTSSTPHNMSDREAKHVRFGDTGAALVDTSSMGGEDTPFIQTATMVEQPFLIHAVRHIETKYGPRYLCVITRYHDLGPDRAQQYAMTFSAQAPAALQLQTLLDGVDLGAYSADDVFPMLATLVRQGKSYRLADWDEEHGMPALPA